MAAVRMGKRHQDGFARGYIYGALATGIGAIAIMLLADWFLPFVYNIGFEGFQASVLAWLFLGGVIALEPMAAAREES